jgi:hypothetical protein
MVHVTPNRSDMCLVKAQKPPFEPFAALFATLSESAIRDVAWWCFASPSVRSRPAGGWLPGFGKNRSSTAGAIEIRRGVANFGAGRESSSPETGWP